MLRYLFFPICHQGWTQGEPAPVLTGKQTHRHPTTCTWIRPGRQTLLLVFWDVQQWKLVVDVCPCPRSYCDRRCRLRACALLYPGAVPCRAQLPAPRGDTNRLLTQASKLHNKGIALASKLAAGWLCPSYLKLIWYHRLQHLRRLQGTCGIKKQKHQEKPALKIPNQSWAMGSKQEIWNCWVFFSMHSAWNCCKFTTGGFLISLRTHLLQWVAISLGTCMYQVQVQYKDWCSSQQPNKFSSSFDF